MKLFGLIVAIVVVIGCGGPEVTGTADEKAMVEAMQKAGGDVNKLDPAMRKKVEERNNHNQMSTANRPGGPGNAAGSGAPQGYPTPGGQ